MPSLCAGVSGSCHDDNSLTDGLLSSLVDYALRAGNVLVSAKRDIQHSNIVALAISDYPLNTPRDIFFGDTSLRADLNQDELSIGCQPAVHPV